MEILVQDTNDLGVRLSRRRQVNVSNAVAEKAQSVAPHPLLVFRSDIHPIGVLPEGPFAKNSKDFIVGDLAFLFLGIFQDAACLSLREQPVGPHDQALTRAATLQVFDRQLVALGELSQVPPPDGFVDVGGLVFVGDLGAVQGLIPNRTDDLDKATLIVPAPICRPAAKFQSLADSLGLAVLLVTDVALGTRGLGMRPVGDLGLGHPSGRDFVGLVAVARSAMVVRLGHVCWGWPFLVHSGLLFLPLLRCHFCCSFGFLTTLC
mmetsp:Transcript_22083/g.33045  ORF Transcript_22083/g.33045 Transcript_22083/m.33045 type:complete len:263 (+) Transcript_22083:1260-2048(+)